MGSGVHRSDSGNAPTAISSSTNTGINTTKTSQITPHTAPVTVPSQPPKDRLELVESPLSKLAYKDFYRHFRGMERESVEAATKYAQDSLQGMPLSARWRVLLELADLAKRSNDFDKVRYYCVCVFLFLL